MAQAQRPDLKQTYPKTIVFGFPQSTITGSAFSEYNKKGKKPAESCPIKPPSRNRGFMDGRDLLPVLE
jgi:hypothetical protein